MVDPGDYPLTSRSEETAFTGERLTASIRLTPAHKNIVYGIEYRVPDSTLSMQFNPD